MNGLKETSGMMPPEYAENVRKPRNLPGKNSARKSAGKETVPEGKDDAHPGNDHEGKPSFPGNSNDVAAAGKDFQPSPGSLNHSMEDLGDYTQEEVEIGRIEHFVVLPDYREHATHRPYLVNDGERYKCLDGWSSLEQAQTEGRTAITCWVRNIPNCSTGELALEKTALRVAPRVGRAQYAEVLRNIVRVEALLLGSDEDLRAFSHGGDRRGEAYAAKCEEDVKRVIATRLNKDREQISGYLVYGSYISGDAFETLIQHNAPRRFFELAQKYKRPLIDTLKHAKETDEEIQEKVSAAVIGWLEQFTVSGSIEDATENHTPENREPSQESQHNTEAPQPPAQRPSQRESEARRASSPAEFQHHTPEEESETEAAREPETFDSLKLEAQACTGELDTAITDGNLTLPTFAESVRIAAEKLLRIHVRTQRLVQAG